MELQSTAPARRRSVIALGGLLLALTSVAGPALAVDNTGLGPVSIRNQFPITLRFLDYTPEPPATLRNGTVELRYQFELTNTFINAESPLANNSTVITQTQVSAGLTPANFPTNGYGVYVDAEMRRQVLRLNYGLADSVEVGLEMAWVTYGGGFLDSRIESVEHAAGGFNKDRQFSDRNRFDFYVTKDQGVAGSEHFNSFVIGSSQPATNVMQDPVFNLKWNLSQGGDVLPALTVKLSYKRALERQPTGERALVASGGSDFGYYFLFSKAVGDVVGHIQVGQTQLQVTPNTFADRLRHRMFGIEFRLTAESSFLLQSVTQTSIFLRNDQPGSRDFDISRPTDVFVFGYKHLSRTFLFEIGGIEDYNQQRNEADITFYFSTGWRW
jgi:Protein of unknown function (DUF3187)